MLFCVFFFFKQKTAYEMRISDWSSDVCSSDLPAQARRAESPLGPVLSAECWPPLCWEFSSFRSSICRSAAGLVRNGLLPPVRRDRSPIMRKVLALTLTSLLGACQLAPPHARPALPTAQDYPTSSAGDVVLGRRAVEISWRAFVDRKSPRLNSRHECAY